MLEPNRTIHRKSRAPRQNIVTPAPFVTAPAPATLTLSGGIPLPKLPASIPSQVVSVGDTTGPYKHLLAFIDAGLVSETDLPKSKNPDPHKIIENALASWAKRQNGKLGLFKMAVTCLGSIEDGLSYRDDQSDIELNCGVNEKENYLSFAVTAYDWDEYTIGPCIERLENDRPGLGKTVIATLTKAIYQRGPYCVTPDLALDLCRYAYWMGSDDETDYIAEIEGEGVDPEDVDVYRKADFFRCVPEWAVALNPPWTLDQVREACESDSQISAIAQAVLPLMEKNESGNASRYHRSVCGGMENTSPSLILRWHEDDDIMAIYDDSYRMFCEGEGTEVHRFFLCPCDPAELELTMKSISTFIDDMAEIETLLRLVIGG